MTDSKINLAEVERFLSRRSPRLQFSPRLEAQFERETSERRSRLLRNTTLSTIIVYNLLIFGDVFLAPDVLFPSIALHLLVVTPWMLFVAWLAANVTSFRWREVAAASTPVAIAGQVIATFCMTDSPYAAHYLYFVPISILGLNSVQLVEAAHTRRAAGVVFAMLLAALAYKRTLPVEVAWMQILTYAVAATVTLNANILIERERRRHYLSGLRDRLRAEESDAHANHDSLTGLGNRRLLHRRALELWGRKPNAATQIAAIVFDIDRFKVFNDSNGHARGDACLKRVAACAVAELRNVSDLTFRLGGEEFLVLLPGADVENGMVVAERIRTAIGLLGIPVREGDLSEVVTASFGVAAGATTAVSLDELLDAADAALYDAKHAGRNCTRMRAGKLEQAA